MSGRPDSAYRTRLRTLGLALALSAWAPLATGLAVAMSRSSTQLADFVRRSVELVAVAVAYAAYRRAGRSDGAERARVERWSHRTVRAALAGSALVVLAVAISRAGGFRPGGDVRVGIAVAALGLATNAWFWRRYARLAGEDAAPSPVLADQRRLYRAKCGVDAGVLLTLTVVAVAPGSPLVAWTDLLGSVVVASYLAWSATRR